jgi:hypothetical protein
MHLAGVYRRVSHSTDRTQTKLTFTSPSRYNDNHLFVAMLNHKTLISLATQFESARPPRKHLNFVDQFFELDVDKVCKEVCWLLLHTQATARFRAAAVGCRTRGISLRRLHVGLPGTNVSSEVD